MLNEKVIFAGFGGQGVMSMGQMLTYAGMIENKQVSWLPSYGAEMRGGTANCHVILSEKKIGSPVINKDATVAVIMNGPSLDRFEGNVKSGGSLIVNSSLVERKVERNDVKVYYVPANDIASELGNLKIANMVALGAYIELTKSVKIDSILEALIKVLGNNKMHLVDINREALMRGAEAVKS